MKPGIMTALRWMLVLMSVYAPFLVLLGALFLLPHGIYIGRGQDALDWLWLILLAGMMVGIYYLTIYVVFDASDRGRRVH